MAVIGKDIDQAIHFLNRGELVAVPTETVYGLGGNALNPETVLKIFKVKERPSFDPLIVHIGQKEQLSSFVLEVTPKARLLAERFWPGPLTLLLQKREMIPDIVTSGLKTVGIRLPDHPLTLALLNRLDYPLAAPSANPFGYVSPTTADHVNDQMGSKISYILDGGACPVGIESTIIGFENDDPVVHRLGGKTVESIEAVVGPVRVLQQSSSRPSAPGMLQSHYAPGKQVLIGSWSDYRDKLQTDRTVMIRFRKPESGFPHDRQFILSSAGNLSEAAKNLFAALRLYDTMPVDFIIAEPVPEEGLGRAINDRLRRAAAG